MAEMPIRPATLGELDAVERIVRDAYRGYVERLGKEPGPMRDDYRARIVDGSVWVAGDEREIAGILVLLAEPDHLLLDNVAVAPAAQGKGVGRRLLAFAEAEARRRGYREIRLYTNVLMHENVALYTRLGYEETGRGEQAGYNRVFMRKELAA